MKHVSVICALLALSCSAHAEMALVVHPSNTDVIDSTALSSIFLGKSKSLPSGRKAVAVMPDYEAPELEGFLSNNFGKSTAQFRAYWSKKVFTGDGTPPQIFKANQDILDLVARNPDVIGIADVSAVKDKVRVIKY